VRAQRDIADDGGGLGDEDIFAEPRRLAEKRVELLGELIHAGNLPAAENESKCRAQVAPRPARRTFSLGEAADHGPQLSLLGNVCLDRAENPERGCGRKPSRSTSTLRKIFSFRMPSPASRAATGPADTVALRALILLLIVESVPPRLGVIQSVSENPGARLCRLRPASAGLEFSGVLAMARCCG